MNKHTAGSTLVAILGAALLLISFPASAGKPTKPGGGDPPPDPCAPTNAANWAGFPAYAFIVMTGAKTSWTYEIRVASKNGLCSRRVGDVQPGRASTASFAFNSSSGEYLVAYMGSTAMLARFRGPFTPNATTPISATISDFRPDCCINHVDLSPDGAYLAYSYQNGDLYPEAHIVVASLADPSGASDQIAQIFSASSGVDSPVWWSPWGKLYYKEVDVTNGRRLMAIDPFVAEQQDPAVILQLPNVAVGTNELFDIQSLSGGYNGLTPTIVIGGLYLKTNAGAWCSAVYAVDADTHEFTLGSKNAPSAVIGFDPTVTKDWTMLISKADTKGSCSRNGYIGEAALPGGSDPSIVGQVQGAFPAALKGL